MALPRVCARLFCTCLQKTIGRSIETLSVYNHYCAMGVSLSLYRQRIGSFCHRVKDESSEKQDSYNAVFCEMVFGSALLAYLMVFAICVAILLIRSGDVEY